MKKNENCILLLIKNSRQIISIVTIFATLFLISCGTSPTNNITLFDNNSVSNSMNISNAMNNSNIVNSNSSGMPSNMNMRKVPSNLVVNSTTNTSLNISWNAVDGVDSYKIRRDGVEIANFISGTTYTDMGLNSGNLHSYEISACSSMSCSVWSSPFFAVTSFNRKLTKKDDLVNGQRSVQLLSNMSYLHTAKVGSSTYLFVAGNDNPLTTSGITVLSVANNGSLYYVGNISDTDNTKYLLDGIQGLSTAQIGSSTYLFAAGQNDNGISVFRVANNGSLNNVYNITDNNSTALKGVNSLSIDKVGGKHYLFATGQNDNGVSVFRIANNGSLSHVYSFFDTVHIGLSGANSVATAQIGDNSTYLFVTANGVDTALSMLSISGTAHDYAVNVFRVANNGSLSHVQTIFDNSSIELHGANSVSATQIGNSSGTSTYLFVAGNDNGVSVFRVANDGKLSHIYRVQQTDNNAYRLSRIKKIFTYNTGSFNFLFTVGQHQNNNNGGVTVFSIQKDGRLSHFATNSGGKFWNANSVSAGQFGSVSYLFVGEPGGKNKNNATIQPIIRTLLMQ